MENNDMTEQTTVEETTNDVPEEHTSEDVNHGDDDNGSEEQDTFPRSYVEKLRKESAGYRERAGQADTLARRLHEQLVKADGRLADPADLEFDPEHLEDGDALGAAITALIEKKPGLRARQVTGDVGAGSRGTATAQEADLISIIRGM